MPNPKASLTKVEDHDTQPLLIWRADLTKPTQRFIRREAGQYLLNIFMLKHLIEIAVSTYLIHTANQIFRA
jgi:hypothetical protein